MAKKFYWLKLKDNFFSSKEMKKLRKIAGGEVFTIIYLKMQLLSLKDEGRLFFDNVEKTFEEELALELDETVENIQMTVGYLKVHGLIEICNNFEYSLPQVIECIGSDGESNIRVARHREKIKAIEEKAKANKLPYIEKYQNDRNYGGNYYLILNRDGCKCAKCESAENLNIHHIIGDREDEKSCAKSSLITLCSQCHSKEHAIPHSIVTDDILHKIGFDFDMYFFIDQISNCTGIKKLIDVTCNDLSVTCNTSVTKCNTEIEIEKDIDIKEKQEKEKSLSSSDSTVRENLKYSEDYFKQLGEKFSQDKDFYYKPISPSNKEALHYAAYIIMQGLNARLASKFRIIDTNLDKIKARLKTGATVMDCIGIVKIKLDQWGADEKMNRFLRPATLFGREKFEQYFSEYKQKLEENGGKLWE